nr:hypothetical protein [Tanacetum cinerariifolium]
MIVVDVDAGKLGDTAHASQLPEAVQESLWRICDRNRRTVKTNRIDTFGVNLLSRLRADILG